MKSEQDIQRVCTEYAKIKGWYGEKIMKAGRNGFPDYIYLKNNICILVEFKRPGGVLSEIQKVRIKQLDTHGTKVHVVSSLEQFKRIFDGE